MFVFLSITSGTGDIDGRKVRERLVLMSSENSRPQGGSPFVDRRLTTV